MDASLYDTRTYRDARIAATQAEYAWRDAAVAGMTAEARAAWQDAFRSRFAALLGGLEGWERPPLAPEVVETEACDGYRREGVVFTTRPGLKAFGWFLVPENCPPNRPAILCLPGHGVGVDGIVGVKEEEYHAEFALQCVRRGYPTLALEQIAFGRRRDEQAKEAGLGTSSCGRDSMAALMLGETMSGWRVWDAMRALDYLETRTEYVDPKRLAVMGISGGGLTALFTGALDTRVVASVVSGYFNTFASSVLSINHCVDNYVPGLLHLCEMPDLAALVAPRALFAEQGTEDPIFPLAAFEQAMAQARDIYATFGVSERFDTEVFEGGHRFHGKGAFAFLERVL
ncbi:MAG TPA: alpha/beta hydrolase family protein [Chthonomonadaceae bacterium]|nr:alpha/beta hydrolase family protein [Chthonomonadaceae bacterium]